MINIHTDFNSTLYYYSNEEKREVGKVNKDGIIKWINDTPPEGIDIEYIPKAKGWIDSKGNVHLIDRNYPMTSERFESLVEELRNTDFSDLERVKELVKSISEKVPVYVRRRNHLEYSGATAYIEVGYLNSRGDLFYNEPPKTIDEIDLNNLLTCWGGACSFCTMEDKGAIETPTARPNNHTGELLAQYHKLPHEAWIPHSVGFFKDGKVTYWAQYDTYVKE